MSQITTHVLDVSLGRPAANVPVTLEVQDAGGAWREIARGATDSDGRLHDLTASKTLYGGTYRISFNTLAYFASRNIEGLYPEVIIVFHLKNPHEPYHLPLLLSPYGYSTYRGS